MKLTNILLVLSTLALATVVGAIEANEKIVDENDRIVVLQRRAGGRRKTVRKLDSNKGKGGTKGSKSKTAAPTSAPTSNPTSAPTSNPTSAPTSAPTKSSKSKGKGKGKGKGSRD